MLPLSRLGVLAILAIGICVGLQPSAAIGDDNEQNFVPIFDGTSLTGWTGAVDGYTIEDGCLVSKAEQGGILYTEHVYGDFVLRFDFLLSEGGNNGIGLRVPAGGHPSRDGMEIQILDNGSQQYAHLSPYQYHGSVYGIAPAKRGYLREAGQWNEQEIRCIGRHVTVILNGETIVDTNLDEALAGGALDGRDHPGALRENGHLALCGHSTRVAFRNLRVQVVE